MGGNILFLVLDQWRAEALSCLGGTAAKTPNLDTLAEDGWMALHHYTVAAPCGPSRASLLTGLYAQNHRSVRNGIPLADNTNNIAQMLRQHGYDPMLFGYTDTSADPRLRSSDDPALCSYEGVLPGFSIGAEHNTEKLSDWLTTLKKKGYNIPLQEQDIYRARDHFADGFTREAALYAAEDSDSAFLIEQTINYLKKQDTPWCVHLSLLRPHPPWIAPAPYNALIDTLAIVEPSRLNSQEQESRVHPYIRAWMKEMDIKDKITPDVNLHQITESQRCQIAAIYYGLLAEVDAQIGRLFAYLKQCGQFENTLIVVTADHGEQLGEHWLWGKGGFYDASYHIPLIIRDPTLPRSKRGVVESQRFTESVDIVPTLLDWLGLPPPPELSGSSLLPLLRAEKTTKWREHVVWEFDFRNVNTFFYERQLNLAPDQCSLSVLRDHHYKYVHFVDQPSLLFDLANDPKELQNLANEPEQSQRLHQYCNRLLSHKMLHQERALTNHLLTPEGVVHYAGPRQ